MGKHEKPPLWMTVEFNDQVDSDGSVWVDDPVVYEAPSDEVRPKSTSHCELCWCEIGPDRYRVVRDSRPRMNQGPEQLIERAYAICFHCSMRISAGLAWILAEMMDNQRIVAEVEVEAHERNRKHKRAT